MSSKSSKIGFSSIQKHGCESSKAKAIRQPTGQTPNGPAQDCAGLFGVVSDRQSGGRQFIFRAVSAVAEAARIEGYRNKCAIPKLTVQSSLMRGCRRIAQRKRRPFPGGVFSGLEDRNQLVSLVSMVSILMP
jgi:hypothetical protein